jgi:hypothetical protein
MFDGIVEALGRVTSKRNLVERRGHYRIPCRRSVNILLDAKACGGHMLNLSPKGMKVRSHDRLPPGRELKLVVSGKKSTEHRFVASIDLVCRIIWCKFSQIHGAYDAGLAYVPAPGVDLDYVDAFFRHELGLEDLETYQKRTSRRVSTELDVTCYTPDGRVTLGAIRDISPGGALFEGSLEVEPGSEIRLRIEVEERKDTLYCVGTVARCKPAHREGWFEIGLAFTEIGDKAELQRLISREMRPRDEA